MATTISHQRMSVRTASGLDIVAGAWIFLSPFLLGFSQLSGALWNNLIIGAAVIIFSASHATSGTARRAWASWINVVLGTWLILSPFILGFSADTRPFWNNIVLGAVVVILALISGASSGTDEERS